jgi:DNA-binding transcriptional LysR family regulator
VHSTFAPRVVPAVLGALAAAPHRVAVRDAHSHEVEALVLDGVADVGFAIPGPTRRGLRRVALPADPVGCFVALDHPIARMRRPSVASLRGSLIAVNEWGDGAEESIACIHGAGVEEWRVRRCGDAATALALARDHGHVAFVSASSAEPEVHAGRLRRVHARPMPRWVVRLELLYRVADQQSESIRTIRDAF